MIRIQRAKVVPAAIDGPNSAGGKATSNLCAAVDQHGGWRPPKRDKGHPKPKSPFEFDPDIYGHASVKSALVAMQHGKCAFCESKILHITPGDVEHFRPKAGFRQASDDVLIEPGYYWLAYDWDNLLLSCSECNRRHKKNLFPLANPAQRSGLHHRTTDIRLEEPLFVDPSREDPTKVIEFNRHVPRPRSRQAKRGKAIIAGLGLDRTALNEARNEHLGKLISLVDLLKVSPAETWSDPHHSALVLLRDAVLPEAQYSAMVACYFRDIGFDLNALKA